MQSSLIVLPLTKPNAIFFDLDGTLVDTAPDFEIAINKFCVVNNLPQQDYNHYRNHINLGVAKLLVHIFPQLSSQQQLLQSYRLQLLEIYNATNGEKAQLFTGARELIELLNNQQISWGIVTNKYKRYIPNLFSKLGLETDVVITPDDVAISKPDPEGLLLACSKVNVVNDENVWYIGDSPTDMLAAKNAKLYAIKANYGYVINTENWQQDCSISSLSEIFKHLQQ